MSPTTRSGASLVTLASMRMTQSLDFVVLEPANP
jgi:hypothetical protein